MKAEDLKPISVQEIRIGNLIDENGKITKVTPPVIEVIWAAERDWIKPIPLTEEWLFKVGFEIDGVFCDYILRLCDEKMLGYSLEHNRVYLAQHYKGQHFRDVNLGEFKYLHDLQNLYYILTETELKIQQ